MAKDLKATTNTEYDLKCPYCGYEGEYCDFPDLFYEDESCPEEQYSLLQRLQQAGFNVVTCGTCGDVMIHELK